MLSINPPTFAISFPSPSELSTLTPLLQTDIPLPAGRSSETRSKMMTSQPCCRSATAAVRPPIPPPTIMTFIPRLLCLVG